MYLLLLLREEVENLSLVSAFWALREEVGNLSLVSA
jgi:hypothetical protein